MKQQHALVTGGTGFVGSHLVRHLLTEGWEVHVLVRPGSTCDQLTGVHDRVTIHRCGGDVDSMRGIVRNACPDVVFHLASWFLSEHQPKDIERLIESNLLFGTQLVEAITLEGMKYLVNTGTSWQHYENHDYSPVNLYAATKQAFETLLQFYVEARDLRVITLKLFDTYGTDDPRPKLINLLRRVAIEGESLAMSPGEQLVDLVHVDDVVRAFRMAGDRLVAGAVCGHECYAVSSTQPMRLREVVALAEFVLERRLPIDWGGRPYRDREVMRPWSGNTIPGWKQVIPLRTGLSACLAASGANESAKS